MCFAHETMLRNRVLLHARKQQVQLVAIWSGGLILHQSSSQSSRLRMTMVYPLVTAKTVLLGFVLLAVAGPDFSG